MNNVSIIGNLTRDPENRSTPSGTEVCNFSIAYNDRHRDKVYYFDITAWGKQAEVCGKYITKGSSVAVEGRLVQETWEDKDGNKKSRVSINAQSVEFLDKKSGDDSGSEKSSGKTRKKKETVEEEDDSLPF